MKVTTKLVIICAFLIAVCLILQTEAKSSIRKREKLQKIFKLTCVKKQSRCSELFSDKAAKNRCMKIRIQHKCHNKRAQQNMALKKRENQKVYKLSCMKRGESYRFVCCSKLFRSRKYRRQCSNIRKRNKCPTTGATQDI